MQSLRNIQALLLGVKPVNSLVGVITVTMCVHGFMLFILTMRLCFIYCIHFSNQVYIS